jgi:hypothetical protein
VTYDERISVPGQPDRIISGVKQWYDGPAITTMPSSPVPATKSGAPAPAGNVLPYPSPMTKDGGPKASGTSNTSPPAVLLPPVAAPQAPVEDNVVPEGKIIGVWQVNPDGSKTPARRYDENDRLIEEPKNDGPSLPSVPVPTLPKALPALPPLPSGPDLPPPSDRPKRIDPSLTTSRTKSAGK